MIENPAFFKIVLYLLQMPRFIFWCAFEHLDFRLPEFDALADLFHIELQWVDRNQSHPWVIIDLQSVGDALKLCSRSISTKFCAQLWTQSDDGSWQKLHENVRDFCQKQGISYGPEVSFKMHMESFMKKLTNEEKLNQIESFDYMPVQGPVKLKDPDVTFITFEFYGFDHNKIPEEPQQLFFGTLVAEGQRDCITK